MSEDIFLYETVPDSRRLVIMFSSVGAKRFNGYKTLHGIPVNRLFVRDPALSWYNGPVAGWWNNADGLLERLRSVTNQFDPANIVCMGGSMGGYGALLFGSLLQVGAIAAFSPQIRLDSRLPNNPGPQHILQYPDAHAAIAGATNTAIHIWLGSENLCDVYNIMDTKKYRNVRVSNIYGAPHNVLNWLLVHGVLDTVFAELALSGSSNLRLPLCSLHEDQSVMQRLQDAVEAYYFQSPATAIAPLEALVQSTPQWSAAHCWLGMARARANDDMGAVKALRQATRRETYNPISWFELAVVLRKLKQYQEAESAMMRAIELSPPPVPAPYYHHLGIIYMFQKKFSKAREAQGKTLEIEPRHANAHYQLGLIHSRQDEHAEAIVQFEQALALGCKMPNLQKHLVTALYHAAPDDFDRARAVALCPEHPLLAKTAPPRAADSA